MENELNIYTTDNQYESAWIVANGGKLVTTSVKSNGFVQFTFENKDKCLELVVEYNTSQKITKIPVKKFVDAIRNIKQIIHKTKETNNVTRNIT